MVGLLFFGAIWRYKGNAVVNALFSRSTAAGGAVVVLSTKPCQLEVVWKIHQSLWKNVEIRPKTNDVKDGKTTPSADLVHFSAGE